MRRHPHLSAALTTILTVLALLGSACANNQANKPAKLEDSTKSVAWASQYSSNLTELNTRYEGDLQKARESIGKFSELPGALDAKTDWASVKEIYIAADEAGRSEAAVGHLREARLIERFFNANNETLTNTTASAVASTLKKEGYSGEGQIWGATKYGLTQGTKKALLDKLHSSNDAHRLLEEHSEKIGKKSTMTLEEQIDTITFTSYFVFVELVELRQQLQAYADTAKDAASTLDGAIEEQLFIANDEKTDKATRKNAEARVKKLQEARTPIEAEAEKTRKALERIEADTEMLQKEYKESFDKLIDDVDKLIQPS